MALSVTANSQPQVWIRDTYANRPTAAEMPVGDFVSTQDGYFLQCVEDALGVKALRTLAGPSSQEALSPLQGLGTLDVVTSVNDLAFAGVHDTRNYTLNPGVTIAPGAERFIVIRARDTIRIGGKIDARGIIVTPPNPFQVPFAFGSYIEAGAGGSGGGGDAVAGLGKDGTATLPVAAFSGPYLPPIPSVPGLSGAHGAPGAAGTPGAAGAPGTMPTEILDSLRFAPNPFALALGHGLPGAPGSKGPNGGNGGSAGLGPLGGAGGLGGAAGAGGGGVILIAPHVILEATADIDVRGTDGAVGTAGAAGASAGLGTNEGGAGGGGGGGGGQGGSGGLVAAYVGSLTLIAGSVVRVNAGAGGLGGAGGAGGLLDGTGANGGAGDAGADGAAGGVGAWISQPTFAV